MQRLVKSFFFILFKNQLSITHTFFVVVVVVVVVTFYVHKYFFYFYFPYIADLL